MMRSLTFVFAAFAAFSTHLVSTCTNTTNSGSPLLKSGNDPPQPPSMLGYVINHFALVVSNPIHFYRDILGLWTYNLPGFRFVYFGYPAGEFRCAIFPWMGCND